MCKHRITTGEQRIGNDVPAEHVEMHVERRGLVTIVGDDPTADEVVIDLSSDDQPQSNSSTSDSSSSEGTFGDRDASGCPYNVRTQMMCLVLVTACVLAGFGLMAAATYNALQSL